MMYWCFMVRVSPWWLSILIFPTAPTRVITASYRWLIDWHHTGTRPISPHKTQAGVCGMSDDICVGRVRLTEWLFRQLCDRSTDRACQSETVELFLHVFQDFQPACCLGVYLWKGHWTCWELWSVCVCVVNPRVSRSKYNFCRLKAVSQWDTREIERDHYTHV